ncbi:outer membrane beta-barrel protein [Verrucomicrobiaceae bacterium N1E253]|uniref:Outer membrane beta-barrel protein n=1 Tax=Oceaniferula marina TaxID=2748318 RepID=A0A851GIP9_9BACT|nr:outer membrane beta-barrel protein [Oceaniferula marina]NWK55751.1 outer membrane beta-barrel protein [Oceaniferula marina]
MKKIPLSILTGICLASMAQAGEDYSAKAAPAVAPAPCLWSWFAGGSGGYVDDWDEDMWTLHLGKEYKCPDKGSSHAIFLEVGYTDKDWSGDYYYDLGSGPIPPDYQTSDVRKFARNARFEYSMEVIPITLNYKYERPLWRSLNWYVGGGLGIAITEIDVELGNLKESDDETAFYGQLFAGLVWNLSDAFEIFGGARWIYMDSGLDDVNGMDIPGVLDDDIFYELGGRFNF